MEKEERIYIAHDQFYCKYNNYTNNKMLCEKNRQLSVNIDTKRQSFDYTADTEPENCFGSSGKVARRLWWFLTWV